MPELTKFCFQCGQQNNLDAQFCQRCGARYPSALPAQTPTPRSKGKFDKWSVLGIAAAISLAFTLNLLSENSNSGSSKTLTLDVYESVQTGATYGQACEIIGKSGIEQHRSEFSGHITVTYIWRADGLGSMTGTFQDNKLVSKSQFGLR